MNYNLLETLKENTIFELKAIPSQQFPNSTLIKVLFGICWMLFSKFQRQKALLRSSHSTFMWMEVSSSYLCWVQCSNVCVCVVLRTVRRETKYVEFSHTIRTLNALWKRFLKEIVRFIKILRVFMEICEILSKFRSFMEI